MGDRAMLGDGIESSSERGSWNFSGSVPKVFETHVQRSVPLYAEGHDLILRLADFFLSENSVVYDIGCSTGLLLRQLAEKYPAPNMRFVGLDREGDMIAQAGKELHSSSRLKNDKRIELIQGAVEEYKIEAHSADMFISYYTIQFILPKYRQLIFNQIFEALNWGGGLLLFEKVRASDARFQDIFTQIHFDVKRDFGYNDEEILSKSRSLRGVLDPYSTNANIGFMRRAGFKDIITIIKYLNFEGFLAIK